MCVIRSKTLKFLPMDYSRLFRSLRANAGRVASARPLTRSIAGITSDVPMVFSSRMNDVATIVATRVITTDDTKNCCDAIRNLAILWLGEFSYAISANFLFFGKQKTVLPYKFVR